MKTAALDAAARTLDPAPRSARPPRARADLDRILATPRATPERRASATPRRGMRVRRFALAAVVAGTGARTAAGAEDADSIAEQCGTTTAVPLQHGDTLRVGALELEVIGLRGHTPGSVALLWRGGDHGDHLFTGDSLFPGGVANTQQDPERFAQLLQDVEQRVFAVLDDATHVYPGHGDDTTLGAERPSLPTWRARGW